MKVLILAGGQGTRMREETEYKPKPMVDIGGRPIIWHIMKTYAHYGIKDFVICLGYKGSVIKEYFLNYDVMNNDFTVKLGESHKIVQHDRHGEEELSVTLADTGIATMTGGRIKRASRYIEDDLFAVTYGDGLADVNLKELLAFHKSHGKLATLTAVQPVSRFGLLDLTADGHVQTFSEKPNMDGYVNGGYFIFHKKVLDYLGSDETILEREPLERLAKEKQLMAFRHPGFFFAMDTYREYKILNDMWDAGNAPWKVWE
jgi:glucose-1-phosphate cytidylyltransferase